MHYPDGLYDDEHPNGINFYIIAKSATVSNFGLEAADADTQTALRDTMGNQNRSSSEHYASSVSAAGTVAGAAGGFASGGSGASWLGTAARTAAGGVVGGTAGRLAGEIMERSGSAPGSSVQLAGDISLYVPQSVVAAYSANWDEVDLGPFAGTVGTSGASFQTLADSFGEGTELTARGAVAAAANIPAAVGIGDINFNDLFEATSKKVGNPYKEQLFKSMGFRQFSFQYVFSPKNAGEASRVNEIIKTFKENMHPDVSPDGMFLIYPSEFIIEFSYRGAPNPHLPKVSNCALKNVKLTYGPDGMMNTFQGSGGIPTEITMELQFVELETLTRPRLAEGF